MSSTWSGKVYGRSLNCFDHVPLENLDGTDVTAATLRLQICHICIEEPRG
jgi:hypothetical protein